MSDSGLSAAPVSADNPGEGAASKAGGDYVAAVACLRYSFDYVNYKGEASQRHVTAIAFRFGKSKWHPEDQWLMMALDHHKNQPREFAMRDMSNIICYADAPKEQIGGWQSPLRDLIMRIDIVAQNHLAYSQACNAVSNLRDHLSAMAFCEEVNRREMVRPDRGEVAQSTGPAPSPGSCS